MGSCIGDAVIGNMNAGWVGVKWLSGRVVDRYAAAFVLDHFLINARDRLVVTFVRCAPNECSVQPYRIGLHQLGLHYVLCRSLRSPSDHEAPALPANDVDVVRCRVVSRMWSN